MAGLAGVLQWWDHEEREAEITIRKQIEQLIQLNEGQPYTYERTELIKMLDDALAQSRPRTQ